MAGLAFWLHARGPGITDDQRESARRAGLTPNDYVAMTAYMRGRKGSQMNDHDWSVITTAFRKGSSEGRVKALMAMRTVARQPEHSSEAVGMAKEFLASGAKEGRVPAIQILHSAVDPQWKDAALSLSNDPDKEEAALGKALLTKP